MARTRAHAVAFTAVFPALAAPSPIASRGLVVGAIAPADIAVAASILGLILALAVAASASAASTVVVVAVSAFTSPWAGAGRFASSVVRLALAEALRTIPLAGVAVAIAPLVAGAILARAPSAAGSLSRA